MKLHNTASAILNDAIAYLDQISPAQYAQEIDLLSGASIGQHTRHFIEFFQCLVRQAGSSEGIVDYAQRNRDKHLESNPEYAVRCIRDVQAKLNMLVSGKAIKLECSEHLPGNETLRIGTNLERELMYNIEHTIHHLAIIKIGLRIIDPGMPLPRHFGVAPSTILHRNEKACAR